ncbi:MAG: choice-of-anchor K domain-containing protein [Microcoleaceae cyanobacterium]
MFKTFSVKCATWTLLTAAVSVIGLSRSVQAVSFAGNSSGSLQLFPGTFGADLSDENGGTSNRVTWGEPTEGSFRNFLQYDGRSFTTEINQQFAVGQLTYRNGEVIQGSHNLDSDNLPLEITLTFSDPLTVSNSFSYNFDILQTPNETGDPVLDADTLSFAAQGETDDTFTVDGVDYTLQLIGFSNDDGNTILNEFVLPEEQTVDALLYAQLTAAAVDPRIGSTPEPGIVLGLGLFGIVGLRSVKRHS